MRIAITGATGNVGTALIRALLRDEDVEEIVGIARRRPAWQPDRVRWVQADMARDLLAPHFAGMDAVVHLAWLIQPSRNARLTRAVNVDGSRRVFTAAAEAGVPTLVYASSVATYRPSNSRTPVDERWPTGGIASSYYSQQKVEVERILDRVGAEHPELRTALLRPGLIFQRSNASQVRRLFGGPLIPGWAIRPAFIPIIPQIAGLAGQVIHADDVAELYRLVLRCADATGAYNAATGPPLDAPSLGDLLHARPVPMPRAATRGLIAATWRARIHPVSPDWLDLALGVPVMRTDRARTELGWTPLISAQKVILEVLDGLQHAAGFPTPPLERHAGGFLRSRELRTGIGGPNPEDRRSAN